MAAPDTGDLPAEAAAPDPAGHRGPRRHPGCDLIDFANGAWAGLDPNRDPNDYTLAEDALAWFHTHVGLWWD